MHVYVYINLVSRWMFGMNSETTEIALIKFCNYVVVLKGKALCILTAECGACSISGAE